MLRFSSVIFLPKLLMTLACIYAAVGVNDTDGVARHPFDLKKQKAAVLIFVGTDCPISNSYAPEINRIVKDFADKGLDFYIVYSDARLSVDDANKHRKEFGYTCPGLMDSHQALLKMANAKVTPQAVVMAADGSILYTGRIDDWYQDFGKQRFAATTHELRDALKEIIAGKKVSIPVTKAVGCPV